MAREGKYFCHGCLEYIDDSETSPDARYCPQCYHFLSIEGTKAKKPEPWIPVPGGCVPELSVNIGDRAKKSDRIDAVWLEVESLYPDGVITNKGRVPIASILEHQKGENQQMVSPQENLTKCRTTLAKLIAQKADNRAIGLWKSKVAKAEQLCVDTGVQTDIKVDAQAKANVKKLAHPCYCGCGFMANPGRNFLQGHDARLKSMLSKLDQGRLTIDQLPELVQGLIKDGHPIIQQIKEH